MHGGLANKMKSCSSSERVQAGVGHQGSGYQVPVACGPDEERELETVFIDTGDIVAQVVSVTVWSWVQVK